MRCSVCQREHAECAVRQCKHPAVIKHYGSNVCVRCCQKCKHSSKPEFIDGSKCNFEKE